MTSSNSDKKVGSTNKKWQGVLHHHCVRRLSLRERREAGRWKKLKWRQNCREERWARAKQRDKVTREGERGMSVIFEDEQCPLVTLTPAFRRLDCQIKRGWNRATGGRNRSEGKREQEVVSRPGTLLWPHQSTHIHWIYTPSTPLMSYLHRGLFVHIYRTLPKRTHTYLYRRTREHTARCTQIQEKCWQNATSRLQV